MEQWVIDRRREFDLENHDREIRQRIKDEEWEALKEAFRKALDAETANKEEESSPENFVYLR